jgi:hypothetical protein
MGRNIQEIVNEPNILMGALSLLSQGSICCGRNGVWFCVAVGGADL